MTETHILSIPDLIAKKRDGLELTADEIQQFIEGLSDGQVQDSQVGSMLMAIYLRGKAKKTHTQSFILYVRWFFPFRNDRKGNILFNHFNA